MSFLGLLLLATGAFPEGLYGLTVERSPEGGVLGRIDLTTGVENAQWPILPSIPNEIQFIESATQAPDGSLLVVWRLRGDPIGSNELIRVDLATGLAHSLGFLSDGFWLLAFGPGDRLFGLRRPRNSAEPPTEVLFEIDPETAVLTPLFDVLSEGQSTRGLLDVDGSLFRFVGGIDGCHLESIDTQAGTTSRVFSDMGFCADTATEDRHGNIILVDFFTDFPIGTPICCEVEVARLDLSTGEIELIGHWGSRGFRLFAVGGGSLVEIPTTSWAGKLLLAVLLLGCGVVALRYFS